MYACMYVCMYVVCRMYVRLFVCICMCACMYALVNVCMCMYICVYVCMYALVNVCMCACMYVCDLCIGQNSVLSQISKEIHETTRNHHETTTKPVTKPLVFYRQIYETTFLKKKRFLVHINNIYRIHRFRGKCGKNRVVS